MLKLADREGGFVVSCRIKALRVNDSVLGKQEIKFETAELDVVSNRCPDAIRCADPFYAEVRVMPMWCGLVLVTAVTTPMISP